MSTLTPELLREIQASAAALAQGLRLPLRSRTWRGQHGAWRGAGSGSSIDFQDHRPYLPGDDPRYIDWQAFARSGNYTLKLYQEEVSPAIVLVLDTSPSMFLNPAKSTATASLFAFAVASALRSRAALRIYRLSGSQLHPVPVETAQNPESLPQWSTEEGPAHQPPALDRIPWRKGSLRVWISDLLFPGSPLLTPMAGGPGVLFAPWSQEEATPGWSGNMELIDCESGDQRRQMVTPALLESYQSAYQRHFTLWRQEAARHQIALARIEAEAPLLPALHTEALPEGAVEVV